MEPVIDLMMRRKSLVLYLASPDPIPQYNIMRFFLSLLLTVTLIPSLIRADDPPEPNYVFRAELVRIVDGNTVAMNIDLGFGVWVHNQSLSLLEADKTGADEATKAKDMSRVTRMRELLQESSDIVVKTMRDKDAKPPKYFAEIWADGTLVNAELGKVAP